MWNVSQGNRVKHVWMYLSPHFVCVIFYSTLSDDLNHTLPSHAKRKKGEIQSITVTEEDGEIQKSFVLWIFCSEGVS